MLQRNRFPVLSVGFCLLLAGAQFVYAGGHGVSPITTVRDLINSGQARHQVVETKYLAERTEIEIVISDVKGNTIGGYAPPYLQSEDDARALWKDFVTSNLAVSALPEDISVREQRKSEDDAFAVAFVLDHSPSMTIPRAIRMQKAIQTVLSSFNKNDYVSVVKFTGRTSTEVELTNDREKYMSSFKVNGLNLRSNGTAIYDGAKRGLEQLDLAPTATRRFLIVFTDGEDNSSITSLEEVLTEAKKTNTTIHTVVYGVANDTKVGRLAAETGGTNFRLKDVSDFDRVFLGIYNALRHSYILTITTKGQRDVESNMGGIMTAAGSSAGSIRTNDMLVLMPRTNVEVSRYSTDEALVMNVDLTFDTDNGDVLANSLTLLDSVATVMVQRVDLGLDIVSSSSAAVATQQEIEMAQRRVRSVRDVLIRRGINPARIQSYANRAATTNPMLQRVASATKITFVFTKL